MNIAFLCVVIASVMPFMLSASARVGAISSGMTFDNHHPRQSAEQLTGWSQRLDWAQRNALETLPMFIGAVLMASHARVPQSTIDLWAMLYVAIRVIYAACYFFDLAALRSMVWAASMLVVLRLMVAAL